MKFKTKEQLLAELSELDQVTYTPIQSYADSMVLSFQRPDGFAQHMEVKSLLCYCHNRGINVESQD